MQAPEKASTQWAAGVLAHAISPPGAGHMVIDIVFYVGLSATIIAGLDIFLSEQQKRWLDGKVFQLWNWLDDCKRVSLLVWLRKLSRLGVFAVAILLSCALILWIWRASPTPRGDPTEFYGTIFVILLLASIFGTLIIRGALKSTTLPRALLRITIYAILCLPSPGTGRIRPSPFQNGPLIKTRPRGFSDGLVIWKSPSTSRETWEEPGCPEKVYRG
jgi:hypothetical protein